MLWDEYCDQVSPTSDVSGDQEMDDSGTTMAMASQISEGQIRYVVDGNNHSEGIARNRQNRSEYLPLNSAGKLEQTFKSDTWSLGDQTLVKFLHSSTNPHYYLSMYLSTFRNGFCQCTHSHKSTMGDGDDAG